MTQQTIPNILISLAHLLETEIINQRLNIPEKFGKGYCAGFVFNEYLRMTICNYELHEDLIIKNPEEINTSRKTIFFKFQHIFTKTKIESKGSPTTVIPSVLIATSRINTDEVIAIHTNTETINVEVDAKYLSGLLDLSEKSTVLQSLLQNTQPLLFEQIIYPSLQKTIDDILIEPMDKIFELFYLRIKAEELVCKLLMELEKRNEKHLYPLNQTDIQTIYRIKEQILEHLDTPPILEKLAEMANMSSSKLKRLFKQIFGNSIFNYYQNFRMKEAARLLVDEKRSVSDVGYELGFTNLSHFSRVFKEHNGLNPKKYSQREYI